MGLASPYKNLYKGGDLILPLSFANEAVKHLSPPPRPFIPKK